MAFWQGGGMADVEFVKAGKWVVQREHGLKYHGVFSACETAVGNEITPCRQAD